MNKAALYIAAALLSLLCLASIAAAGDTVVIVNKANTNAVNKSVVTRIYTGAMASWPGGGPVAAVDLPENSDTRAAFSSRILGKSVSSLKTLWSQNIFTGRTVPPKVVESDDDVVAYVARNKNAIGYVNASAVNSSVKVAFK